MRLPELQVNPALRARLSEGHPWIYRNQIATLPRLASGAWVRVRAGNWQGIGLWDASSPIAVRVFARATVPDRAWLGEQVRRAWELRDSVRAKDTTAWRWLFGESDGVPGITVDLYGDFAVVQTYAESVEPLAPLVAECVRDHAPLRGVLIRRRDGEPEDDRDMEHSGKIERMWGTWPPRDLIVREHGLQFQANLFAGQKTGLFLDHRENRLALQQFCRGKTVLNCFAYTGAFSLYAARGGAARTTSCDIAAAAIGDARVNFKLNGFDPEEHDFVAADVWELLETYRAEGRTFDVVVLDPPSFARSRKHVEVAVRAYGRLNTLAIQCVSPGGLLVSASCTSQVSPEMFRTMLAGAAARAGKRLLLIHEAGQPVDHPVAAHFPEGRYLKFAIGRVVDVA